MHLITPLLLYLTTLIKCDEQEKRGISIGIDLGTTYSCLRIFDPNINTIVTLPIDNKPTFPSTLAYDVQKKDGKYHSRPMPGNEANEQNKKVPDADNYFYAFKRLMGMTKNDIDIKDLQGKLNYKIAYDNDSIVMEHLIKEPVLDKNGNIVYKIISGKKEPVMKVVETRHVKPIDASSEILKYIYKVAQSYSSKIDSCVVTVPAYFTENQVKATNLSAELAGLTLSRTMNEPVAAAYAYQIKNPSSNDTFLVIDIGGGTLDISVLEHDDGILEVRTYSGDNFLGGENVNDALEAEFVRQLKNSGHVLVDQGDKVRLRAFVEDFKIMLCNMQNKADNLDNGSYDDIEITKDGDDIFYENTFYVTEDAGVNLRLTIGQFNAAIQPVLNRVRKYITDEKEGIIGKYKAIGGSKNNISKVLFVGGSSRIPAIRRMVGDIFGYNKLNFDLNADTCVAEGAAWYSANLAGFLDEKTSLYLVDVVPMHVGICVNEDVFESILEMNQTIPATGSKTFTTAYDMQERVSIQVGQGLRYSFKDNNLLGKFDLHIKNPGPRGVPQIEVTVSMDKDRNVHVKAMDKATGLEEKITFTRNDTSLSAEQISKMKKDKEDNEEKDREMKERYDERSKLEAYIDGLKKRIVSDKTLSSENVSKIDKMIGSVNSWLQSEKDVADKLAFMEKFESLKNEVEPLLKGEEKVGEKFEEKVREEL